MGNRKYPDKEYLISPLTSALRFEKSYDEEKIMKEYCPFACL
jgi:hypothetical protein